MAFEPLFIDHLLDFLERLQPFEEGLRPSIRMALLELIQNFSEHSKSEIGAWIAGQFDPAQKRINLCVMDFGVGIPESLRRMPKFYRYGDERLIELATEEGISSVINSSRGLGLTAIRRFVSANRGALTILSGTGQVTFSSSNASPVRKKLRIPFLGTAAFLSLVPTQQGLFLLR
ncbi:MAG: ATP-binding protein [Candidatus Binataceae bacterium]